MTTTFVELKEKLCREEECFLLELLGITSEDIVERFQDIIEDKFDFLLMELGDDDDT